MVKSIDHYRRRPKHIPTYTMVAMFSWFVYNLVSLDYDIKYWTQHRTQSSIFIARQMSEMVPWTSLNIA